MQRRINGFFSLSTCSMSAVRGYPETLLGKGVALLDS
jgi:hypothetical protein